MRHTVFTAIAIVFCSLSAALVIAQDASIEKPANIPADSKFVIKIDLSAIKRTQLGATLFRVAKEKAIDEFGKKSGEKAGLERIQEMLGLDPFEDVQSITLSSSEYDSPEKSMLAMVRLKRTTGNLEGMVLGLPEYVATDYKQHQIHSTAPDRKMRIYGAFHGTGEQDRVMILCPNKNTVQTTLDQLDSESNVIPSTESTPLIHLQVFDIPHDKIGNGPQANIAKILKSLMMEVNDNQENISVTATMTTETENQSQQVHQMASGLMAMIDFAQSMDSGNKDIEKLRELVAGHESKINGTSVQVMVNLKASQIASLIAESAHLNLPLSAKNREAEKQPAKNRLAEARLEFEATKKELEAKKMELKALMEKSDEKLRSIKKEIEESK